MSIIITYELDQMWSEVKDVALHNGFDDFLYADDGSIFYLPNTTLKCNLASRQLAMDKFRAVVRRVNPHIKTKILAFDWENARLFDNKTRNVTHLV